MSARLRCCALLVLAVSCGSPPEKRADSIAAIPSPAANAPVAAPAAPVPAQPSFVGEEEHDPTAEGVEATMGNVRGTATWAIERDPLDLRRKVTIRIALNAPDATIIVLRTIDSLIPAPGLYTLIVPSTGATHLEPHTIHGEIRTTEVGAARDYVLGALDQDTVRIDSARAGAADSTLRGRIRLRGARYGARISNTPLHELIYHTVQGNFVAPPAGAMSPGDFVTPAMQEAVLRRALDGFVITNTEAAANGVEGIDSTAVTMLAKPYLESRWGAAAVVEDVKANGMTHYVRLRGRFVPTVCEMSSRDSRIVCH